MPAALELEPEPEELELELELELAVAVLAGEAVATAPAPPEAKLAVTSGSLLPIFNAADIKLSKVLPLDGALIAPTMPRPQWGLTAQKNQMGS